MEMTFSVDRLRNTGVGGEKTFIVEYLLKYIFHTMIVQDIDY